MHKKFMFINLKRYLFAMAALCSAWISVSPLRCFAAAMDSKREQSVKDAIKSILASEEFSDVNKEKSFLREMASFFKKIYEWVMERLQSLGLGARIPDGAELFGKKLSPGASIFLKSIGVLVIVVIIFVLFYFLSKNFKSSKRLLSHDDEILIKSLKSCQAVEEKALEHYRNSDYRLAFRFLFISLLLNLNENNEIRLDISKTNRQYIREMRNSSYRHLGQFSDFAAAFNLYWYGNKKMTKEEFDYWYEKFTFLRKGGNI